MRLLSHESDLEEHTLRLDLHASVGVQVTFPKLLLS